MEVLAWIAIPFVANAIYKKIYDISKKGYVAAIASIVGVGGFVAGCLAANIFSWVTLTLVMGGFGIIALCTIPAILLAWLCEAMGVTDERTSRREYEMLYEDIEAMKKRDEDRRSDNEDIKAENKELKAKLEELKAYTEAEKHKENLTKLYEEREASHPITDTKDYPQCDISGRLKPSGVGSRN